MKQKCNIRAEELVKQGVVFPLAAYDLVQPPPKSFALKKTLMTAAEKMAHERRTKLLQHLQKENLPYLEYDLFQRHTFLGRYVYGFTKRSLDDVVYTYRTKHLGLVAEEPPSQTQPPSKQTSFMSAPDNLAKSEDPPLKAAVSSLKKNKKQLKVARHSTGNRKRNSKGPSKANSSESKPQKQKVFNVKPFSQEEVAILLSYADQPNADPNSNSFWKEAEKSGLLQRSWMNMKRQYQYISRRYNAKTA